MLRRIANGGCVPVLVKVPVLAVCLLLGALGVAPVQSADWDAVTPPDMGKMFSDPVYVQSMANALSAARQAEAERATLSEQAAREDSETAYAEVSSAQAHDLAQQQFPSLMTEGLDELGLPRGVRVKDFLAPNVAQLVNSEGKMSLLVGSEELATKDGSGELEQVDLSLRSEGGDYVPVEPAVDLTIPHQADEYLTLEQTGLGVRPADAPATSGLREDDRVFYPEVEQDTDFISMPTRTGAEVMWQLRSADAAESLALDLDLPEGASARLISGLTAPLGRTADPASVGVEIVRDGTVLDTIAAPTAFDADGVEVPASYRLDGDRVIVDVAHRAADVKYPIAVDPEVHEVWGGVDYNANCNTPGAGNWHYQTFVTALGAYCTNGTPGLYVQSDPGVYYGQNAAGQWWWGTPASVHIISGWLDGLYHVPQASNFYDGIYQASHGWETVHNYPGGMQNAQDSLQAVGWDENFVVFGMTMLGVGARGGYGLAAIRGANIRIGDSWSPQYVRLNNFYINGVNTGLQSTWAGNQATPWLNGYESLAAQVSALDTGLGIYHVGIDQTSGGDYLYHHLANCTGNRAAPCSLGALETGALNFGQLKGIITLRTFASDITDNVIHGPQWVARIDRDNPKITLSGQILEHAQVNIPSGPYDTLHVSVTDGDGSSPQLSQSGVRKVAIQVDGVAVDTWTNSNPDATNNNYGWDYVLPVNTNGTHTVHIIAWDAVGRTGTADLSFISNPYATSYVYGGVDHAINTTSEISAVVSKIESEPTSERARTDVDGIAPLERPAVNAALGAPDDGITPDDDWDSGGVGINFYGYNGSVGFFEGIADKAHISSTPPLAVSAHGCWKRTILTPDGAKQANIDVKLEQDGVVVAHSSGSNIRPGCGRGKRVTARANCVLHPGENYTYKTVVDVDILNYKDDPRKDTQTSTLSCSAR